MSKIVSFFKVIRILIDPAYKRKMYREWAWLKLSRAFGHLMLKPWNECDRGDVEAARIINAKMKELA